MIFNKNKDTEKGAGMPKVHVVICQLKGGNYPVEILEFDATQDKDNDYNMFITNDKKNFKEELERKRHYIIDYLTYKLNFSDNSKQEKLDIIDAKIRKINDEIRLKENAPKKTVKIDEESETQRVNSLDLKNDLRHYKVLRYTIENEGDGSYEIINKNGQREVRFLSKEGIFHPYFYRSDRDKGSPLTMYPDISLSRKYYREIDDKITDRFLKQQNTNFFTGIKGIITMIIIALLIISNIMWASNNYKARVEIDEQLEICRAKCVDSATDCAYYYGKLIEGELINNSVDYEIDKPDKKTTGSLVDLSNAVTGN